MRGVVVSVGRRRRRRRIGAQHQRVGDAEDAGQHGGQREEDVVGGVARQQKLQRRRRRPRPRRRQANVDAAAVRRQFHHEALKRHRTKKNKNQTAVKQNGGPKFFVNDVGLTGFHLTQSSGWVYLAVWSDSSVLCNSFRLMRGSRSCNSIGGLLGSQRVRLGYDGDRVSRSA